MQVEKTCCDVSNMGMVLESFLNHPKASRPIDSALPRLLLLYHSPRLSFLARCEKHTARMQPQPCCVFRKVAVHGTWLVLKLHRIAARPLKPLFRFPGESLLLLSRLLAAPLSQYNLVLWIFPSSLPDLHTRARTETNPVFRHDPSCQRRRFDQRCGPILYYNDGEEAGAEHFRRNCSGEGRSKSAREGIGKR